MRPIWDDLRRKVERATRELPDGTIGPFVNDEFGDVFGTVLTVTGGRDYTYAGSNRAGDVGWCLDDAGGKNHPVSQKEPNELGIYDMSGNVWEWCWDWYGGYSTSSQTDPTGPSSGDGRVLRGGSWFSPASTLRCATRSGYYPDTAFRTLGFRVVRTAGPAPGASRRGG